MKLESSLSKSSIIFRETPSSIQAYHFKRKKCKMIVGFIANKYKKSLRKPEDCNFVKKETLAHVCVCEFCKVSENTLITEHLWMAVSGWLLLVSFLECFLYFPLSKIFATKKVASCEKSRLVENRFNDLEFLQ